MDTNAGKELYRTGLHRDAESDAAASQWNGLKPAAALSVLRNSEEWRNLDNEVKNYGSLQAQVNTMTQQIADLNKKVNDLTVENSNLKAQLAAQGSDTTNLNALGKALQWFLVRMGLK